VHFLVNSWSDFTKCTVQRRNSYSIYYSASSLYMFRVSTTPIVRSTVNCNYSLRYWSYFLCSYLPPKWLNLATVEGGNCTVPEPVVTVLCTPDDGFTSQPKHVQWTCRIINRLFCIASRWTIINLKWLHCTERRPHFRESLTEADCHLYT